MIQELRLKNFKCFEEVNVQFSNLNVLAGINSTGKSSIIQSLLLVRQSFEERNLTAGLTLNGDLVNIGTGRELLYADSNSDEIHIDIDYGEEGISFYGIYHYEENADFLEIVDLPNNDFDDQFEKSSLLGDNFAYVSSYRLGPQEFYRKSYKHTYQYNHVGYSGEYYADFLAERGHDVKVENDFMLHPNSGNRALLFQLQEWLSVITPGLKIETETISRAGIVSVAFSKGFHQSSPKNVGFGISYVAPILISLLKATKGDLVIIENPEVHLHPQGQRIMGELMAKAAAGGVQVIVETHSDHVLNGIRLSVKNKILSHNKVKLNYFFTDLENGVYTHKKTCPDILENGKLTHWPEGFFDEWDKALMDLF